ncbi:MAG TPA: SDR family oxidoreductase [Armatimonadota bacterium]|nr:SDR family oxidoreductase [Armatimonadota bacterium]
MAMFLVTGGAGFIGSAIVEELIARGHEVRVLDNFSTGKHDNLDAVRGAIRMLEGDLRDPVTVRLACSDVDYVLHQAALASVARSLVDPVTTAEVNLNGTLNVLMAARDAGVRRVVFAGSSSVYGDNPQLPKREDAEPRPLSPYAVSKLAGEHYCRVFHRLYGLQTVVLRYFNVYGPRQRPDSQYAAVIPKFADALLHGQRPVIHGDGAQSRDFTYVANVVQANLLACEAPQAPGGVFNIACGSRVNLLQLLDLLRAHTGNGIAPEHAASRPGDVLHSVADISRAASLLGYTPQVDIREGLRRTVEWHRSRLSLGGSTHAAMGASA